MQDGFPAGGASLRTAHQDQRDRALARHRIVQGDWPWHSNRGNTDRRSIWHNDKGRSRFNRLFGDGHIEYYKFPEPRIMDPWIWSPAPDPNFTWW